MLREAHKRRVLTAESGVTASNCAGKNPDGEQQQQQQKQWKLVVYDSLPLPPLLLLLLLYGGTDKQLSANISMTTEKMLFVDKEVEDSPQTITYLFIDSECVFRAVQTSLDIRLT
ncbi:uncharacterized protein V6R79_014798 [Siganus canaliculatus]